eukprot:ctg_2058.g525
MECAENPSTKKRQDGASRAGTPGVRSAVSVCIDYFTVERPEHTRERDATVYHFVNGAKQSWQRRGVPSTIRWKQWDASCLRHYFAPRRGRLVPESSLIVVLRALSLHASALPARVLCAIDDRVRVSRDAPVVGVDIA